MAKATSRRPWDDPRISDQRLLWYYENDPVCKKELNDASWSMGNLQYKLRKHAQRDCYRFAAGWKKEHPDEAGPIVLNCHRGMGKSYLGLLMCIERCLHTPNQEVRFGSPTGVQTRDIAHPILRSILEDCPAELQPEKSGNNYYFKNPAWQRPGAVSTLHLVSCKDEAQSKRGPRSDFIFLDECRDIDDLQYVIDDVLWFHFTGRPSPLMILSSTPPDSCSHPYWLVYQDNAEREGRYIRRNVEENKDFTSRDEKMLLAICKDKKSTTWKREALCLKTPNEKSLLIPEFITDDEAIKKLTIVEIYPRPEWYHATVAMDLGCMDNTAALYGYIDFENKLLVIEDEIVVHYKSLGEIADLIKSKASEVWPSPPYPIKWIADNNALELMTLRRDHGIYFSAADKWDVEGAIASLRTKFSNGRIRIQARCKRLIQQLESGLKDEKGRIMRDENPEIGHLDAIMALVYMNRMISWDRNPIPIKRITGQDIWHSPSQVVRHGNISIRHNPQMVIRRKYLN